MTRIRNYRRCRESQAGGTREVAEFTAFGGLRRNLRPGVGERFVQQYFQAVCSGGGLLVEACVNEFCSQ